MFTELYIFWGVNNALETVDTLSNFLSCLFLHYTVMHTVCVCETRGYVTSPRVRVACVLPVCMHTPSSSPRPIHTHQEHVTAWLYPPRPIRVLHPRGNTGCDNRVSCRSCKKSSACGLLTDLLY